MTLRNACTDNACQDRPYGEHAHPVMTMTPMRSVVTCKTCPVPATINVVVSGYGGTFEIGSFCESHALPEYLKAERSQDWDFAGGAIGASLTCPVCSGAGSDEGEFCRRCSQWPDMTLAEIAAEYAEVLAR